MKKIITLFLVIFISCGPSEEEIQARIDNAVEQATSTTSSTTTTLPTTTSTMSESEKQELKICRNNKRKILDKVTTTYNILDKAFDQVVFIEDNGFKFDTAIQTLEEIDFYDFRNPQNETERKLDEIEQLLENIMPTAIYGLEIYYEGYKLFLRDGNDSRAESKYLQGDPFMDESFDEVSRIKDKIININC